VAQWYTASRPDENVEAVSVMSTVKDEVRKILEQLPDDVTFEDVQYHICVRQKLERGLEDLREGRVLSSEEMEHRFARWLAD
jgi:hypothetical protein